VGSWVGFNDRRVAFRTSWWGQGAHNALHVVGEFVQDLARSDHPLATRLANNRFEPPSGYVPPAAPPPPEDVDGRSPVQRLFDRWEERNNERRDEGRRGRIGW